MSFINPTRAKSRGNERISCKGNSRKLRAESVGGELRAETFSKVCLVTSGYIFMKKCIFTFQRLLIILKDIKIREYRTQETAQWVWILAAISRPKFIS